MVTNKVETGGAIVREDVGIAWGADGITDLKDAHLG